MIEKKEPIAYDDPRRANKMLDIVCNMYKCKYDILKSHTLEGEYLPDTAIIINIGSLIADWVEYSGKNASFLKIDKEEIVPKILEVAAHYRRFYNQYGQSQNTWVFLVGLSNMDMYRMKQHPDFPDTNWFDPTKTKEDFGQFYWLFLRACKDMKLICNCIPGLYYVDTCLQDSYISSGMITYFVLNQMMYHTNQSGRRRRVLIVSGNELDFSCLGENTPTFNYKIYGFKRRHQTIFTYENIFSKLIFGNRKKRLMIPTVKFAKIYSIVMVAVMHKITAFKMLEHIRPQGFRQKALFDLFKDLKEWLSEKEITDFIRRCEKVIREDKQIADCYDRVLDVVNATSQKITPIQFDVNRWKVDMVDYQIEQLNDQDYKRHKINFLDLM